MKSILKNLSTIVVVLLISFNAKAETTTFGAMAPGSAWYMFGATLSEIFKSEMPDIKLDVIARGGGVSNPVSVATNKTTIALSNRATAVWATNGTKPYKKEYKDLRALIGGLNQVRVTAIATRSYVKKSGNDSLEKIINSKLRLIECTNGLST
jgi:hypothetical protein